MIFSKPLPFAEAVQSLEARSLLPTDLGTQLLREIEPEVLRRAFFSAKVADATHLQQILDSVEKISAGTSDRATQRAEIKKLLASMSYQPDAEQRGGLQDLSSDARINLQLDTNVEQMQGAGYYAQAAAPEVLDQWPAQELIRVANFSSEHKRDWPQRWLDSGGQFYGQRMIALRDDSVWAELGNSSRWPDGLDNNFPPFAFNSGMDVRLINRDEAMAFGLIDRDTQISIEPLDLNAELKASPDVRASWLRDTVSEAMQGIAHFDAEGVLRFVA